MTDPRLRRLLTGGILALLCAQLLYGALMLSALYKQYQEPVFQINGLVCRDIADHLGLLVRVGKSLRPQTVERFLSLYRTRTEAENIAVTDGAGNVIFQWDKNGGSRIIPPADADTVFGSVRKFSTDEQFWTTCPISGRQGVVAGHVLLALNKERISGVIAHTAQSQLWLFLGVSLAECLLLVLLMRLQSGAGGSGKIPSGLRLRLSFMMPLILGQILFLLLLHTPLSRLYEAETAHTGRQLARQMTWDLERLAGMGLPVSGIHGMQLWMMERQQHVSTLGMAVFDVTGRLHAAADANGYLYPEDWKRLTEEHRPVRLDICHPADGSPAGSVQVLMNPSTIRSNLLSVMLDNLTMTVVAALFLSELIFLLIMSGNGLTAMASSPGFMRPIIFACLFATEMSMSYVPIRIGELGLDLFGLPPEVVSGLPVSCELFMAGLAMFAGGFWSQKSGWKPMLLSGVLLACLGSFASWLSPSALPFILARGMSGLGYGFINLAAQVFVIAHSSESSRAHNLAFMFAGLYAGTLCGSSMGGLIADRLGYQAVFPASAVMLVITLAALSRLLPKETWQSGESSASKLSLQEAFAFLSDRRMGALLLFFIIPNALITVCLFQFFMPLSLSQAGTSPATIGRVFLLYCVIVMFAGPFFGSLLDRAKSMVPPLFLSMLVVVLSLMALLVLDGLSAAMLSVALLAVNTAIASNGQGAYALSLPAAQSFGRSHTMGFYNVAMRIGQVLGPLSLGIMMSVWNARTGITVLAVFTGLSALLFAVLSISRSSSKES
ncbi:MFS transporter [Mailhella massiliensis]|uniref:MFS transporter n=1 Tax=Mailhella massiliensis TaxID=1903261 RepID=UPI00097DCAD1|nr:MFS transporter [Mailhella massiliensis]